MKRLYQTLLDTVFPRTAYERWLDHIDPSFIVTHCPPGSFAGLPLGIRPLFAYKDQHVSGVIHQAKFFRNESSLNLIAHILSRAIQEEYRSLTASPHTVITWIPARRARLRHYGYCQGMLLACELAALLCAANIPASHMQFLRRAFAPFAPEQKLLSRKKRLARKNPFMPRKNKLATLGRLSDTPIHIWIIDDVATTGFTLDAARETLYRHLLHNATISIHCLAFAH